MSKSKDLREAAVAYRLQKHTLRETSEVFRVNTSAVNSWVKKYQETGDLSNKPLNRGFKKRDPEKLKALKRCGITRKKRPSGTKNNLGKK